MLLRRTNSQGMGAEWQWRRSCPEISNSSPQSVSSQESLRARGRNVSEWEMLPRPRILVCRPQEGTGRKKPETRRSPCHSDPGAERQTVVEKKKEYPHLSHRQISGYLRHDGYG